MFPSIDSVDRCFASLHWVLRGRVPQLQRYYQNTTTSYCHLAALRFLRLAIPWLHSLGSLPDGRVRRQGLELVTRCLHPGITKEQVGLSQVPGEPLSVCTCSKPTPAGLLAPDHKVQQRGPWSSKGKGSHDWVFRRSIAWLSDSLCTLRDANYSNTTQHSLPVAGQALLDGIRTRKVPMKGFKVVNYISFPFPKLCLAQALASSQRSVCFASIEPNL